MPPKKPPPHAGRGHAHSGAAKARTTPGKPPQPPTQQSSTKQATSKPPVGPKSQQAAKPSNPAQSKTNPSQQSWRGGAQGKTTQGKPQKQPQKPPHHAPQSRQPGPVSATRTSGGQRAPGKKRNNDPWQDSRFATHHYAWFMTIDPGKLRMEGVKRELITLNDSQNLSKIRMPRDHNEELLGIVKPHQRKSFEQFLLVVSDLKFTDRKKQLEALLWVP